MPGFLFKAYPSLMATKDSAEVMDAIFAADDTEPRAHLLRIMNSFLLSEMAKHTVVEKGRLPCKVLGGRLISEIHQR